MVTKNLTSVFIGKIILISALMGCSNNVRATVESGSTTTLTTPHVTHTPIPATQTNTVAPTSTVTQSPSSTATLGQVILRNDNLSAGDPYSPELGNRGYDVQQYTLSLNLDPGIPSINGLTTIHGSSTSENLQQITLDFIGYEIQGVAMDGIPLTYFRQDAKLVINLPESKNPGADFSLNIAYSGEPVRRQSEYVPFIPHLGLQYPEVKDVLFVVAEPDGARYWFPANDHPRDKAAYRFELTVPSGMIGVANGKLIEKITDITDVFQTDDTATLYIWEHNYPMASAFVTVAVGEYQRVESVSPGGKLLRHYVFPEQRDAFENAQANIGAMIDWMSDNFGPYPFEAFGYVTSAGLGASLETQTMVVLSEDGISNEAKLTHEMAHMWFGDWVSLDSWGDMWRSEGLATYVADLWLTREDPDALDKQIDLYRSLISGDPSDYPLNDPPRGELFGRDSYLKGAVLVHEMRLKIGDEAFFRGLQTYITHYGGGTATHEEFQTVMEKSAGTSLESFFAEWFE